MQFHLRTLLIVLAILLSGLPVGCDKIPFDDPPPKPPEERQPIYSLEVRLESGITSQGLLKEVKDDVTVSGVRAQVEDEQIIINGKKYGKLRPGDKVLVERDGKVLVNGVTRDPE